MRKIEQRMLQAIKNKENWASGNTAVFFISAQESGNPYGSRSEIYVHGNHIADYWHNSTVDNSPLEVFERTLSRWPTKATKSRLRSLGVDVKTKKGVTYLNGVAI